MRLVPVQAIRRFGWVPAGSDENHRSQTAYWSARNRVIGTSLGSRNPMGSGVVERLPGEAAK